MFQAVGAVCACVYMIAIATSCSCSLQDVRVCAAVDRRLRCAAEGSLAQLEAAYNRLEDSEREKRAAGILKVRRKGERGGEGRGGGSEHFIFLLLLVVHFLCHLFGVAFSAICSLSFVR